MCPAEIQSRNAGPVSGDFAMVDGQRLFGNGKYPAAPQRGCSARSGIPLPCWIAGDDFLALFFREVKGIVYTCGPVTGAAYGGDVRVIS